MMNLPDPREALHKAMLYRLLINLLDDKNLAGQLLFKGGTCAAILGWLDRYSLDLDFDLKPRADKRKIKQLLSRVFTQTALAVKQQAKNELYYVLQYTAPEGQRNTLKLSIIDNPVKTNLYAPYNLPEINRYAVCQTRQTMFANKLVAVTDRFRKYHTIAGRDLYDLHYFYLRGYSYHAAIIKERTGMTTGKYLKKLANFIQKRVTEKIINQDLNVLLPPAKFQIIRKTLKTELLMFLQGDKLILD